jgi:phosphatidylserine/phosphatidylglycerophosphate/cardiolipin synthase-like enzyme
MTLLVRDEADVIRANIEHHLAHGVDLVIATDNGSIDGTREILGEYARRGAVVVIDQPANDYRQWVWVTDMARLAAIEHDADWILHADADEFWWADCGDLKAVLAMVPPEFGWVNAKRFNFVPVRSEEGPFFERLVVRHQCSRNPLGRPLGGKICHRADPDVLIGQGNHDILSVGLRPYVERLPITILHFPLRTYAQFERKIVLGGRAYARNTEFEAKIGDAWRYLYAQYLSGNLRNWYDRQIPAAEHLARGFAVGHYFVDRRLERFCCAAGLGRTQTPAPRRRRCSAAPAAPTIAVAAAAHEGEATLEILASSPRADVNVRLEARLLEFIDSAEQSIACAAFDLRATAVAAALHEARERGVALRLLHDSADVVGEAVGLDPKVAGARAVLESWQLPCVMRPRVHHRFLVRDGRSIWTGSANLTPGGLQRQDNDCVIVHDATIAQAYLAALDQGATQEARAPLPDGELLALFAPGDAIRRFVVSALASAECIRVMAFTLADPPILTALRRRREAGADIAGVYDPDGMAAVLRKAPRSALQFWFLIDEAFVAAPNHPFDSDGEQEVLHNRLLVIDDMVITGSASLVSEAFDHEQDALVIRSPSYAAIYRAYVETVAAAYRDRAAARAILHKINSAPSARPGAAPERKRPVPSRSPQEPPAQ